MNPNFILSKYLTKSFLVTFLGVLLMVLGVVFMFEIIELLRRFSGRDAAFSFILKMGLTKMPRTIEMIFPFVVMIAGMITFWKFSKSNEFVVIRVAGVSIWGFLAPIVFITFIVGAINVAAVNPLSSWMYEVYETLDYRYKTKNPEAMLFDSKGLWFREAAEEGKVVILQAKSIKQEEKTLFLKNITIIEMDKNSIPILRIEAFAGDLYDGYFELKDVKIFKAGEPTEVLNSMEYKTSINIDRIRENFVEPEAISFWDLPLTIKFYEASGFSARKHYLRYMTLLVSPFLLCSMILVSAVFSLRPNTRRGGVMLMVAGGISTGFLVYFMSQVIYAFGLNGYIPVLLSVCSPFLVITLISVSVLLHLEDG
ncbi:MAG: LptF/LptG family permease [Lactobacillaceae bacterium]|jgi:lipopolysaccharide export system permease protein|nr:LptF/LptG family permease [Lactobacillaceae bacterium]